MDRRTFLQVAGATGAGAVAGCLDDRAAASGEYDVGMSTDSFLPRRLTVDVGATVTWQNTSQTGHTVTAFEGSIPDEAAYFASGGYESETAARDAWADGGGGRIDPGTSYEHTFEVPGSYGYVCIPHERVDMVGSVEVTPVESASNASNASNASIASNSSADGAPSFGVD